MYKPFVFPLVLISLFACTPAKPIIPTASLTGTAESHATETHPTVVDGADHSVRIIIVYDNTVYDASLKAEWGFAAFVEYGGHTFLFDTGGDGVTLLGNMTKLGLDPGAIELIVLSHVHGDHTGGLPGLFGQGVKPPVFAPAAFPESDKIWIGKRTQLVEVDGAQEILTGVYTTGQLGTGILEQALVISTVEGSVVITGCAHPGIVEIVRQAKTILPGDVALVVGGFHLGQAEPAQVSEIISELRRLGVRKVSPTHCTGEQAISMFAEAFGDDYLKGGVGREYVIGSLP